MKRQLTAVLVSGLFSVPAFANPLLANYEIDAGNPPSNVTPTLTKGEVRAALVDAQRAGQVVVNAELGTMAKQPVHAAGKTREQVRVEILTEQQSGKWFILGLRG
jgi:hypothetical protein